jgi:phage tail sheath protein FI
MPVTLSYPGVYVEELSSGVRTITGVATSITAFVGSALRGPTDLAVRIQSFSDYLTQFGPMSAASMMSYAVQQYFQHGGTDAYIVRVAASDAVAAAISLPSADPAKMLVLQAKGKGKWGNALRVAVNRKMTKDAGASHFTLVIQELESAASSTVVATETLLNLSADPADPRYVGSILKDGSSLVELPAKAAVFDPVSTIKNDKDLNDAQNFMAADGKGADGGAITDKNIVDDTAIDQRLGVYALDAVDLFNLLCIPPLSGAADGDVDPAATLAKAATYCKQRRALLVVDAPAAWTDVTKAAAGLDAFRTAIGADVANAAAYFPRLTMPDPLQEGRSADFAPCGAVAGIMARTDAQRGVWKAPAGLDAAFSGVRALSYKLDDRANGRLNPAGLNCLRTFPVFGNVVWGARTMAGADIKASEWKYVPVRRLALFLEESLYRGTQWVVFEPNDEPLWAQIRLNLGAFMHNLFVQGAFQGQSPRDAYFVKCDKETTPQNQIDLGIVNIVVGFAPLKPAEFVVIQFQQIAGQIQS